MACWVDAGSVAGADGDTQRQKISSVQGSSQKTAFEGATLPTAAPLWVSGRAEGPIREAFCNS